VRRVPTVAELAFWITEIVVIGAAMPLMLTVWYRKERERMRQRAGRSDISPDK